MGANMAQRLHDKGYRITAVFDPNTHEATELAAKIGAQACTKLADVTARADIIFTVVPDDEAQRRVFAATGDSLLTSAANKTFVNCATISPSVHVQIQLDVESVGGSSLEACMASSIPQARNGTLYLMCGGRRSVFDRLYRALWPPTPIVQRGVALLESAAERNELH